jgi:hypothetical protein
MATLWALQPPGRVRNERSLPGGCPRALPTDVGLQLVVWVRPGGELPVGVAVDPGGGGAVGDPPADALEQLEGGEGLLGRSAVPGPLQSADRKDTEDHMLEIWLLGTAVYCNQSGELLGW